MVWGHMIVPMPPTTRPQLVIRPHALRFFRLQKVWTQEDLAENSKVSLARIRQLEVGRDPSIQPGTVRKLAGALGCTPEELSEVIEPEVAAS